MHDRKQTKLLVRAREICITCGRRIAEQGEKKCEEKEDVLQCSQRLQAFPLLSAVSDVCVRVQQCTSFQSVMCVLAKPEQKENVKNLFFFQLKKRSQINFKAAWCSSISSTYSVTYSVAHGCACMLPETSTQLHHMVNPGHHNLLLQNILTSPDKHLCVFTSIFDSYYRNVCS